ncbi:MAG: acyl carrier protein [Planctomycetes bacterium]|nr:acyl carrier protein [Planctomycetota bacterium]
MPTTQEIEDKVISIVCKQLGVPREKVSRETSFVNDLGADSLDQVELIMLMEDDFGISIPDEEAEKIKTVGDAVKYIEGNLEK